MTVTLHHGDCLEVLRSLPDSSVDSVVTDPPYGLGFMGKEWDDLPPGEEWARECLRVLKPGGHLLAFGGTRTWHRLACAVEDAGFEVRDSIAWLYGSGFPKSLDVSKAIDKRRDWKSLPLLQGKIREARKALGISQSEAARRVGLIGPDESLGGGGFMWFETGMRVPTREQYPLLKDALGLDDECDEAFAEAEREVLSSSTTSRTDSGSWADQVRSGMFQSGDRTVNITAPATPDAETWQGWGTALKPAFEPVVVARKPLVAPDVNVLEMVESELRNRFGESEIRWTTRPVSGVARRSRTPISGSTAAQPMAGTSARTASDCATPPTASATERCTASLDGVGPSIIPSEPRSCDAAPPAPSATQCSPPTAPTVDAVGSGETNSSPSTTSTAAAAHTDARSEATSTGTSASKGSHPAIESSVGIATGLTGSRAHVLIERLPDGSFVWPDGLPRLVKGGPLTVAANVLTHGTGALNIDGCRIGAGQDYRDKCASVVGLDSNRNGDAYGEWTGARTDSAHAAGRWPANVVLDESQADALDRQSGIQRDGVVVSERTFKGWEKSGDLAPSGKTFGRSGGASRFFYVAKAPKSERPRTDDGTSHPTVKPLTLMRWLVRLVTPPGGTVLEPFAGSGTTVEACLLEGFDCIAIEREADYLPLIEARIARVQLTPPKAPDLFDLLDEEASA